MATTGVAQAVSPAAELGEKSSGPVKLPLAAPASESHPKERVPLTADQQQKYEGLLAHIKSWTSIPSTAAAAHHHHKDKTASDAPAEAPLTDSERQWLTRECILRYLRATKWHPKDAEKRVLETLVWRREYGVEGLTAEHISPENETGKQMLLGYDNDARPCHYLNPGLQNTQPSPRQVQHLVYMLERVIDIMPPGQETLALLINFKQSKSRSNTAPGIGLAREVLHILQNHYPERLGKALIVNVPWVVWGFFKLITPFIDPLTREKLKFNEDLNQYVPSEQLWTEFNGTLNFEYDHQVYWPALTKFCDERRAARTERWIAGGKQIGELEDYLAGALDVGVAGAMGKAEEEAMDPAPAVDVTTNGAAKKPAQAGLKEGVTKDEVKEEETTKPEAAA